MKITKQRLKEIIKEEVQKILEGKKGGFIGPPITEPVFEKEDEETPVPQLGQDVESILSRLKSINNVREYAELLKKVIAHHSAIPNGKNTLRNILRDTLKNIDQQEKASVKEEELDEMSTAGGVAPSIEGAPRTPVDEQ